jgi:hypothetical protein
MHSKAALIPLVLILSSAPLFLTSLTGPLSSSGEDSESEHSRASRPTNRLLKKPYGMLRQAQHARIFLKHFKFVPLVLSPVEGLRMSFSTAC